MDLSASTRRGKAVTAAADPTGRAPAPSILPAGAGRRRPDPAAVRVHPVRIRA